MASPEAIFQLAYPSVSVEVIWVKQAPSGYWFKQGQIFARFSERNQTIIFVLEFFFYQDWYCRIHRKKIICGSRV